MPFLTDAMLPVCLQVVDCAAVKQTATGASEWIRIYAPLGALSLSAFTFWLGYRQKERDRTVGYYQKVVVDVVVPDLIAFTQKYLISLNSLALSVLNRPRGGKTVPKRIATELAIFSEELFVLQDTIIDRTALFDSKTSAKMELLFTDLQDGVTEWFDEACSGKRRELNQLRSLMQIGQQSIVKELYRGKVRNF